MTRDVHQSILQKYFILAYKMKYGWSTYLQLRCYTFTWALLLIISGCMLSIESSNIFENIVPSGSVQLSDYSTTVDNRTLEVQTLNYNERNSFKLYSIKGFLQPREIEVLLDASRDTRWKIYGGNDGAEDKFKGPDGKGYPVEWNTPAALDITFTESVDLDKDGYASKFEIGEYLKHRLDLIDFEMNEILDTLHVTTETPSLFRKRSLGISKEQFCNVNWKKFLQRQRSAHPGRFAYYTYDKKIDFGELAHTDLLQKISIVTGISSDLISTTLEEDYGQHFIVEPVHLEQYSPDGAHKACHLDADLDAPQVRFLTFQIFLNEVSDGGETVFYGTETSNVDMEISPASADESEDEKYNEVVDQCLSAASCQSLLGRGNQNKIVVKPELGRAIFWYNAKLDENGFSTGVIRNSLHRFCPVYNDTFRIANIWILSRSKYEQKIDL